jgi:hypothetical protein
MKLGTIQHKKYKLTDDQYQEIYEMYKGAIMLKDIGEHFNLSHSRIVSVISQINSIVIEKHIKFHKIMEQQTPDKDLSSFRDMFFPCDNHPTVGTVVIKDGEIIHDGNNVTEQFKTLKYYY